MLLYPTILIGVALMILERIIPDQHLPNINGWWKRAILINYIKLIIIILAKETWDPWLKDLKIYTFPEYHVCIAGRGVTLSTVQQTDAYIRKSRKKRIFYKKCVCT